MLNFMKIWGCWIKFQIKKNLGYIQNNCLIIKIAFLSTEFLIYIIMYVTAAGKAFPLRVFELLRTE